MVRTMFQQGDLDYYELTPADLDEETLRKRYRSRMLCVHPDKTKGSTTACVEAQSVYDRLRCGLRQFQELQRTGKVTAIYECVSYKPSRSERCRNLLQLETYGWLQPGIRSACWSKVGIREIRCSMRFGISHGPLLCLSTCS